jgi:polyhydroxyalkanoate synthase
MAHISRIDRKGLATADGRNPKKDSAGELRDERRRASAAAEAPTIVLPQMAPPKPSHPKRTVAAPKPESTAPGAQETASPQETAAQPTTAKLSAPETPPIGQAPPPAGRPAAAGETDGVAAQFQIRDANALARNIGQAIEQGGEVLAAYLRPREAGEIKMNLADDGGEMIRSIGQLGEYYVAHPLAAFEAQSALAMQFINLWTSSWRRFLGAPAAAVAKSERPDKRFSDAEWRDSPYFDLIKQTYVLLTRWGDDLVKRADEMDPHERDKAKFYLRQLTAALSPSNFVATNPELWRLTLRENGENLVRGLKMMAEDIQAGHGNLRIRQSDARGFKLGVNLATTPARKPGEGKLKAIGDAPGGYERVKA